MKDSRYFDILLKLIGGETKCVYGYLTENRPRPYTYIRAKLREYALPMVSHIQIPRLN